MIMKYPYSVYGVALGLLYVDSSEANIRHMAVM